MRKLLAVAVLAISAYAQGVAGKWQLAMDTPHGPMKGSVEFRQDGSKITGTIELGPMGTFALKGEVDGAKIAFDIELPDNSGTVKFSGKVDGDKMSGTTDPHDMHWEATAQRSLVGTLTDFHEGTLEFVLRADSGETIHFHVSPETQVVRIPPGEHDLAKAIATPVTDLTIGDRVLVTFVAGMAEPRRIVRITSGDIAQRNEGERLDWQRRGVAGIVTGKSENEVALELRTPNGAQTIHLAVGHKTAIRRYAPDSVKFTDARPSTLAEISRGDQLRARGTKSEDGSRIDTEEIVFGTFLTILGPITAVDREAGEVHIRDLAANAPVTIRLTAESRVKRAPDMREMFGHGAKAAPTPTQAGMAEMLDSLPACRIDDLKVGSTLVVNATSSAHAGTVTAIMLIANIDGLIQMAQAESGDKNASPMKSLAALHHGMFDGPGGGFSLPAILP